MTTERAGRDMLLEVLASEGVRYVFGNPGTTELPLIDALAGQDRIDYILGLQEATVVAMADGYARSTGRPAFVNVHTSAGLGNAIGSLTNAQANGAPMVVTAGQQDRRHLAGDPLLSGDLVGLARATVKWAHEVRTLGELGVILRRAFHDAVSSPAGPVFVSIPMDVLDEAGDVPVPRPSRIERAAVAGPVEELATRLLLGEPGRVALVAADDVAAADAVPALVEVAELLGAPVYGASLHADLVFPADHALWRGALLPVAAGMAGALGSFERVLAVGRHPFMAYFYSPGPPIPEHVELLQVCADVESLGRTHPVDLGVVGDPRATLLTLAAVIRDRLSGRPRVGEGTPSAGPANPDALAAAARSRYGEVPMAPLAAVHATLEGAPDEVALVDESITAALHTRGLFRSSRPGSYFSCRGGGLGWGMPAAVGVSLGRDRGPVLCLVGDGSALYSPQALWTAAHEDLPVVYAVINNRQYAILRQNLAGRAGPSVQRNTYIGMDLDEPPVDFCALAGSFGIEADRVEKASDVTDAVKSAFSSGRPHLIELPVSAP